MGDAIEYLSNYQILEIANIMFFSITLIVLIVRAVEKILKKIYSYFIFLYNKKRGKENEKESMENTIKRINELSDVVDKTGKIQRENTEMFFKHEADIVKTLDSLSTKINDLSDLVKTLDSKIDAQQEEIQRNREANASVDLTLLRDRILGGMRYFNQYKDEHGNVHISMSDHENMSHLFEEYFKLHGNGSIKTKYENEFTKFIIKD